VDARERQLAIYASEEAALGGVGREFRHLGEVRAYVAELVASDWWADRWPHIDTIAVGRSRSDRFGGYAVEGIGEIRLSSLREPVVLHEIAHVVTPGAGHGPTFVAAFLDLVRERLGFHSYGALLAELRRRDLVDVERDRG
jgi:putative metallohydrolase (TIGR04338 family)